MLFDGPESAPVTLVLAHGAGLPMDSPFMDAVAAGVAAEGFRVARFEFPYMRARREGERRGAPDRPPVLKQTWLDAIGLLGGGGKVVIGGKSLGGRIASMVADEAGVRGLVCLGYPFHPPGQPEKLRTKHLRGPARRRPSSSRGPATRLARARTSAGYRLSPRIAMHWLEDGDHSWKPRVSSGRTEAQNLAEGIAAIAAFLKAR